MTDKQTNPNQSLAKILDQATPELRKIAPKYVNVQRLTALAIEAQMRNPLLAKSSPVSVLNFCKKCAETGTDRVGAGGMWAVPFWNNKANCYDMTPIPDWRLLIEKAKKSKAISHATAEIVREGDLFSYSRGMRPDLQHQPVLGNKGKIIAAYCVYTLPDASRDFMVMDWNEIESIRNRSKAWQNYERDHSKSCPWNTDEAEMSKKTIVKRAMKLFEGASIELTKLLDTDNVVNGVFDLIPEKYEVIPMPKELPTTIPEAVNEPIKESKPIAQDAGMAPDYNAPQETETATDYATKQMNEEGIEATIQVVDTMAAELAALDHVDPEKILKFYSTLKDENGRILLNGASTTDQMKKRSTSIGKLLEWLTLTTQAMTARLDKLQKA